MTEDDVTMQAIVQDSYGHSERWRLAEIAEPAIANSEVLVKVRAAGIDRGTWHAMTGLPYLGRLYFGLRKPKRPVPGLDVAGTVAAIGADVTKFAVGDEVFGISKGSFAERASAREDKLVPKPANITFEQAAVVAISGLTALQGLRDAGRVKAGQHVLIIGASGGVGTFAVQIAKTFGAEVTGVCSTTKTDLVTSIGADHVIDYTRDDFADGPQRYDVILDIGGNTRLSRLRRALTPRGRLVIVGGETDGRLLGGSGRQVRATLVSPFVSQRLGSFIASENAADLTALTELIEAGTLAPAIDRSYPLAETAAAIRRLLSGRTRGKVVVAVSPADPHSPDSGNTP
jgi:NADPH:quinone reductase-like Zn-dependent oxidoreductase